MAEIFEERIVDAQIAEVAAALTKPDTWLDSAATEAGAHGQEVFGRLRADVGRKGTLPRLGKRVVFLIGEPRTFPDRTVLPLTWEAAGFSGLFPVMDALIELHPAGRQGTRIVFWGRYDPPLGRAGDLVDRLLAHRVAEATVRNLLAAFAARYSSNPEHVPTGS